MPAFVPQIIILVFFSLVIAISADLVVKFVAKMSRQVRLSEFITSFLVLGIATSTPEIFVAISSVLDQVPQLSFGNLIGGIVTIYSLVIGLTAIMGGQVFVSHNLGKKELWTLVFLLVSPLVVVLDGGLSRFEGFALIFLYIFYISLLKKEKHFWVDLWEKVVEVDSKMFKNVFFLILGIVGLFISSKVLVDTSIDLASHLRLPTFLIGLILLPLGTNIPEIVLSVESIFKKHKSLAVGDFMGSAAANVLIIGVLAVVYPFEIKDLNKVFISFLIALILLPLFVIFTRSQDKLTRREGAILIMFYVCFLSLEIFLK